MPSVRSERWDGWAQAGESEVRQRETNIILTVKTEDRPCWGGWQENDKRFSVRIQSNIQTIQRATFQLNKMKLEQNLVMTVEMTGIIIGVICHPASPYTLINLALFVMGNFWDHLLFLDVGWTIISPSLIALKLSPVSAYDINYVIPSAYHLSLPSNWDMPTLHTITSSKTNPSNISLLRFWFRLTWRDTRLYPQISDESIQQFWADDV